MSPSTDSSSQITHAIQILQDALHKETINKKAVRPDIVAATNILLGILGLPSVAPDIPSGQ
jgi:hypothetical protein